MAFGLRASFAAVRDGGVDASGLAHVADDDDSAFAGELQAVARPMPWAAPVMMETLWQGANGDSLP
jgi:hypothetical protein